MTARLVFYLGQSPSAPLAWVKLDGGEIAETGVLESADALSPFVAEPGASISAYGVIHGEQVAILVMKVPPKSPSKFKAAARYLLEDELAEPVDAMHVVSTQTDGEGVVLAIRNDIIETWLEIFNSAGITLEGISPDFLCLPYKEEAPVIACDGARIVYAFAHRGFAIDRESAEFVLGPLARDGRFDGAAVYSETETIPFDNEPPNAQRHALGAGGLLALCASALDRRKPVNLLCGKHKPRSAWRDYINDWRRPAGLAAALAGLMAALFVAGGVRDLRAADAYAKRTAALHAQYFPEAAGVDPYVNARAVLEAKNTPVFLGLISALGAAIERADGVQIDRLRYDGSRAQLVISVRSPDDRKIEAFRGHLVKENIMVRDAGGYRRSNNEWIGELIIGQV